MHRYGMRDDKGERINDLLPGRAGSAGVTAANSRLFCRRGAFANRSLGLSSVSVKDVYRPW